MKYNWQQLDWPEFHYDFSPLRGELAHFNELAWRVSGLLKGIPPGQRSALIIDFMIAEAIKTSEIEGEFLSRQDVMSSLRNNLGLNDPKETVRDKRASGAATLMQTVRDTYAERLTQNMLFTWHKMIMQGSHRVKMGAWRDNDEPMQVISGPIGRYKIHFEAPPSKSVPKEMKRFISWFNDTAPKAQSAIENAVIRSGIAHLYFETIHPFEDGNGRIGRAIAEKALSQSLGWPVILSLSQAIEIDRKGYYEALKQAQRSSDITKWLTYFVHVAVEAQLSAEKMITFTLKKTHFFDHFKDQLNIRQQKVIRRMFNEGIDGFEGGMSAKKYLSITRCAKATATRDLQDLVRKSAFVVSGGGRSTRYQVNLDQDEKWT